MKPSYRRITRRKLGGNVARSPKLAKKRKEIETKGKQAVQAPMSNYALPPTVGPSGSSEEENVLPWYGTKERLRTNASLVGVKPLHPLHSEEDSDTGSLTRGDQESDIKEVRRVKDTFDLRRRQRASLNVFYEGTISVDQRIRPAIDTYARGSGSGSKSLRSAPESCAHAILRRSGLCSSFSEARHYCGNGAVWLVDEKANPSRRVLRQPSFDRKPGMMLQFIPSVWARMSELSYVSWKRDHMSHQVPSYRQVDWVLGSVIFLRRPKDGEVPLPIYGDRSLKPRRR